MRIVQGRRPTPRNEADACPVLRQDMTKKPPLDPEFARPVERAKARIRAKEWDANDYAEARKAARDEGFEYCLDRICVLRLGSSSRPETLHVSNDWRPFQHLLVRKIHQEKRCVRIDVFRNDANRSLERSLGWIEEIPDRFEKLMGVVRTAYKGTVIEGIGRGEKQEWHLEFDVF